MEKQRNFWDDCFVNVLAGSVFLSGWLRLEWCADGLSWLCHKTESSEQINYSDKEVFLNDGKGLWMSLVKRIE